MYEDVVHGVHKVVIWLSFGVIRPHKVSRGIGRFAERELSVIVNIFSTVLRLLLMVKALCPISGHQSVVSTTQTKWGDLGGGSTAKKHF